MLNIKYDAVVDRAMKEIEVIDPETIKYLGGLIVSKIYGASDKGKFFVDVDLSEYDINMAAWAILATQKSGFYTRFTDQGDGTKSVRIFWMGI